MKTLKEKLNAKLSKNGGFTLVEMLIVVAIIAILVAVSIPLISNALDKTRHATDEANERAAKSEIMIAYMISEDGKIDGVAVAKDTWFAYHAAEGAIKKDAPAANLGYGQCTKHNHGGDNYIAISYDPTDGTVSTKWVAAGTAPSGTAAEVGNTCLDHALS